MPRAKARDLEAKLGEGRVGLLDDLVDDVHVGAVVEPLAGQGPVLVDQVLAGRLHGRDRALLGGRQVDQLPRTAPRLARDIEVVAQQQQERLAADEVPGAPDGVAVPVGLGLDGEPQPALELDQPPGLLLGPVDPPEGRPEVLGIVAEMPAIIGLVPRCADDADLLDPALHRLFGDDLEDRLGQAVAVDQRQHGLLHRVGGRILPRSPPRRRDDRLGDLHACAAPRDPRALARDLAAPAQTQPTTPTAPRDNPVAVLDTAPPSGYDIPCHHPHWGCSSIG